MGCKSSQLFFHDKKNQKNDNVPEVIDYYGNNSRKIFCDIYIDDKACVPDEFCGKCRKIQ